MVGIAHETAAFAVAAIRRGWLQVGRYPYAGTKRLLLQADGGGANDCRRWRWKVALQGMFSLISGNWAGEPLVS